MEDLLQIGVITSPHGIHGEVKVFPTTDDVNRFKTLKNVLLDTGTERIMLEKAGCKFFKKFAILKFKGIDRIEQVEGYKGMSLWVTRVDAVPLQKDEYFIADLIGISVCTEEGTALGVVKDVMETGANDVYVVENGEGKELLLPAIKDCILRIDIEQRSMTVHLLDGLLDI